MADMDPLQMRPRCGEHETTLQPQIRGGVFGRPQWKLVSQVSFSWEVDLSQMMCPLDPHGGMHCFRTWNMQPVTFTILPHGLLRPTPREVAQHVLQQLGEGSSDGGLGAMDPTEGAVEVGRGGNGYLPLDPSVSTAFLEGPEGEGTVVLDHRDAEGDSV